MISNAMEETLNVQINKEIFSSYLYLSMSSYFESLSLDGCANWMKMQAQEELMHAMKIYDYVFDCGGRVILTAVDAPPVNWDSPRAAFEAALEHERLVTRSIHAIADLAVQEKDHATHNFMEWFVNEQVEEEKSVDDIVQKLKLVGNQGPGLFMLDRELKGRAQPGAETE